MSDSREIALRIALVSDPCGMLGGWDAGTLGPPYVNAHT